MPHRNGTGARPFEVFEFASTGYTVQYQRVPLQLYLDFGMGWRRKNALPPVPQPIVDIGGEKRAVANPSDPDYQLAVSEYETKAKFAQSHFLWRRAIILTAEDKAEVVALRSQMTAEGIELDPDDAWVFMFNLPVGTQEEVIALQNAIFFISQPTTEGVAGAKASFPHTVGS